MPLKFQPKARSIVYCDFSGYIAPEIIKRRPVVVLTAHKRNSKLVTVVPLSTTPPNPVESYHYRLLQNPLPHSTAPEVWAKCDMVAVVSIDRLDLVRTPRGVNGKRQYLSLSIGADQFEAIRRGVVHALGLASVVFPTPQPPAPPVP